MVQKDAIKKLFTSTALTHKRGMPFEGLTLHEFCLFSKSEKAAEEFQNLMEDIKKKTVSRRISRQMSTLVCALAKPGPDKIMPVRTTHYVKNLPPAFNPLMNHFKDEEVRHKIREEVVTSLKKVEAMEETEGIDGVIEDSAQLLKKLLSSHFPKEEIDDQYRKLLMQGKKGSEVQKRIQEKMKEIVASSRRTIAPRQSILSGLNNTATKSLDPELSSSRPNNESALSFRAEHCAEFASIIDRAKKGSF